MLLRAFSAVLLVMPLVCFGGTKEDLQVIMRDISLLSMDLKALQGTVTELKTLMQRNLDETTRANTTAAVIDATLKERLKEIERTAAAPAAGLTSKMDQMSTDFQGLKESVADLTARMGKLQQQILDLSNTIKVMQAPPPPPGSGLTGSGSQMPAETLYNNAMRDKSGGRADLALQGFEEYLKLYGNTEMAPNAQFYIGEIHYSQADFDSALRNFDAVLEKYEENNKTPDALFMKGQTLVKMGRRTDGAKEFRTLLQQYPDTDVAGKAKTQLKSMGLSTAAPKAATKRKR